MREKSRGHFTLEELEDLNTHHLSVRIAYLMVGQYQVFLQEVNPTCYDRSERDFEKEYVELMEKAQAEEERHRERRETLKVMKEVKKRIELETVPATELEKIQIAFETRRLEVSGERISLNRISGDFIEKVLAPKYLRLFGFRNVQYHKRPNDPYDYTGIRQRAFWLIDVKSKKGLPPIFRFA